MCKKSEGVACTTKYILDKMWKQWCIKGGKEKHKENADDKEETTLQKLMTKPKRKGKVVEKEMMEKAKRKRLIHATSVELRGISKTSVGIKILHKCLGTSVARMTRKKAPKKRELG